MKKFLLAFTLVVAMAFAGFANGPLLGVGFVPQAAAGGQLTVGWDFGLFNIEASTGTLTTYTGTWDFGALWTPQVGQFGYRVGSHIFVDWTTTVFQYTGFDFVVGVSNSWGPVQLYGDLRLNPTNALVITPVIGMNILFGDLLPDKAVEL